MRTLLLTLGFLTLFLNTAFVGLLKTNDSGVNEPFLKFKPTYEKIVFYSNEKNEKIYKEFISDHHIQNKQKSLLPFFLIQFTISCFVVGASNMNAKRQFVVFAIHYFFGVLLLFFAGQYLVRLEDALLFISTLALVALNFGIKYVFTH